MEQEIISDTRSTGTEDKYLTFQLDNRKYGIEIAYLVEIVALPDITEIPDMKDYVKGVVDLRGRVIPVFDARLRLGLPETEYLERTCVIVLLIQDKSTGLIVDSVNEVIKIPKDDIDLVHNATDESKNQCIKGMCRVKEEVFILINMEHLMFADHSYKNSESTGVLV